MNCCYNCKKRECEYQELEAFIAFINTQHGEFYLKYCPDAQKCKEYNADLEYFDPKTGDALYIEVKEVHIGYFVENQNKQKGEDNGRADCGSLVSQAIDNLTEKQQEELQDYIVNIPQTFISERDKNPFREKLLKFMKEIDWNSQISCSFDFAGKSGSIKIDFDRKSEEIYKTFGQLENTLLAYEIGNGHPCVLSDIFQHLTDTNSLVEALIKNAEKTGKGKFPAGNARKILLNILRMPLGNEVILNSLLLQGYEGTLIKTIEDNKKKFVSAATESYLLWYCDEYYLKVGDQAKPVLFCIPLVTGFINEPTWLIYQT